MSCTMRQRQIWNMVHDAHDVQTITSIARSLARTVMPKLLSFILVENSSL